jgi:CTP:molybdopterin cytidylyltransferase MocA
VHAGDWAEGLAASLRAGLRAAAALRPEPVAVAVVPVDVPDLDAATVARLIGEWPQAGGRASVDRDTLRQAVFGGRPGHPVVIGRRHWAALVAHLAGDTGARPYLVAHGVQAVECGDLGTGADVDRRSGSNGDAGV